MLCGKPLAGSWASERGGPLLTLACHAIDALSWLMGEPRSVASFVANFQHEVEVEDTSAAVIRFQDGSMAGINATSANQTDTGRLHFICESMSALSNDTPYATTQSPWAIASTNRASPSRPWNCRFGPPILSTARWMAGTHPLARGSTRLAKSLSRS